MYAVSTGCGFGIWNIAFYDKLGIQREFGIYTALIQFQHHIFCLPVFCSCFTLYASNHVLGDELYQGDIYTGVAQTKIAQSAAYSNPVSELYVLEYRDR